jgi:DNA repair protein RecN (Recombination protein N)
VSKQTTDDGRTVSSLAPLEKEERVKELARMIDGTTNGEATLKAAAQMLERARLAAA